MKDNGIVVDFSDLKNVLDDLIEKHGYKNANMGDGKTDILRDSEKTRPHKLDPVMITNRMREIRHYVTEYNQHKTDLEAMGYNVKEMSDGVRVWKETNI